LKTLIIAPHADDEILGCGGLILKRLSENNKVGWLLMTTPKITSEFDQKKFKERKQAIDIVRNEIGIKESDFYQLNFLPAALDEYPTEKLIKSVKYVLDRFTPNEILVPHYGDIHSDHRITFNVVMSAAKSFRSQFVKRIMSYETISETDFNIEKYNMFIPNYFENISEFFHEKNKILNFYKNEIKEHPFPRSQENLKALAIRRGSQSGFKFAEAFMLLKQISD